VRSRQPSVPMWTSWTWISPCRVVCSLFLKHMHAHAALRNCLNKYRFSLFYYHICLIPQ
jgi:hypothetical protein